MSIKTGTVFKNSFRVYKQNFWLLFLPLVLFQIVMLMPLYIFTMPGTTSTARAFLLLLSEGGAGISSIVYILIMIGLIALFFSPLIVSNTVYIIDCDYFGQKTGAKEAFIFSRKTYGSMLKSYLSTLVLALPVVAIVVLVCYLTFKNGFNYLALLPHEIAIIVVLVIGVLLFLLGTVFLPYIVVSEKKGGFKAVLRSFRYVYKGNFLSNLSRLAMAAAIVGLGMLLINWLSTLPFGELFDLYMKDPMLALKHPLMAFSVLLSFVAVAIIAFILPIWYGISYNTYKGAKQYYETKYKLGGN